MTRKHPTYKVQLDIPTGEVDKIDAAADRQKLSRAEFIRRACRLAVLLEAEVDTDHGFTVKFKDGRDITIILGL